jgi:hypothetical protein
MIAAGAGAETMNKDIEKELGSRKSKNAEAWGLNENRAPKLDGQEQARIAERNRLIIQVMEINAKQRHFESMHLGIKLQLDHSRQSFVPGAHDTEAQLKTIGGLEEKFNKLTRVLEKLNVERAWLETALAEIDGAPLPKPAPTAQGKA